MRSIALLINNDEFKKAARGGSMLCYKYFPGIHIKELRKTLNKIMLSFSGHQDVN